MQIEIISPRRAVDNAFLQESITKTEFETFRRRLLKLLNQADDAVEEGESEEHLKGLIKPFFNNTNFNENHYINTKERQDLAIHNGKTRKSKVGVIIEAKRPSNKAEMITGDDLNRKAFHESILYYLRERIDNGNEDIKHIIITDVYHWYVFDAQDFERYFYESKKLIGWYKEWKQGQKVSSRTQFIYDHLSEFVSGLGVSIKAAGINISDYRKLLEKEELIREDQKKLVPVFKLFTPTHLLKQPFASDSNELNKAFYRELLYIMGLKEYKEKGTHYITRLDEENRQHASLIENTVIQLKSLNVLSQLPNRKEYGDNEVDQLFNVAIQLLITWINRILFLKLLEAQLFKYHREEDRFRFLNHRDIDEYDGLNKLFFQVLAVPADQRSDRINKHFGHIPYLNSSLFDVADIERQTIRMSELEDGLQMPVYSRSKIRNRDGKRLKGEKISALEYLLRFLDAYNFNTEGTAEVQEEAKTLINASVLGRIFEKINGYKDGSFFTPGYITEYMCRETIRRVVVQKFNEAYQDWECESIQKVSAKIIRHDIPYSKANNIVNSITVCDPAVGSGHFLVSALNELIAVKSDLRILVDENDHPIRDVDISVDNDELSISVGADPFFEYRVQILEWSDNENIKRTVGPDTQRLQKALFREKNILIENCLFGVDINPNSVNICRLRLWIELLKHAYYKEKTDFQQLEVLPNIDINIKQGNSLVSRFGLDADLSHILANNDNLTIAEYKQAVRDYKETGDREDKRELKEQISSIKESFSVGLKELHPVRQDLKKQQEILIREETKLDLFEGEKKSKKEQKKITKAKKKIGKLENELAELENATFYDQAFEWRFEFPEVLDEEGNFTGFDAVIGNPPYVRSREKFSGDVKKYYNENYQFSVYQIDLYKLFIEKSLKLIKNNAFLSLITPSVFLVNDYDYKLRKELFDKNNLFEISFSKTPIFDDANVKACVFLIENKGNTQRLELKKIKERTFEDLEIIEKHFLNDQLVVNEEITNDELKILNKVTSSFEFTNHFDVKNGIKIRKDLVNNARKGQNPKYFLLGRDVKPYKVRFSNRYIDYNKKLEDKYSNQAFRNPEIFDQVKLIVRQIPSDKIVVSYDEQYYYCDQTTYVVNHKNQSEKNLKFIMAQLSSKLFAFYHKLNFSDSKKTFPKVKGTQIKKFPYLEFDENKHAKVISKIDQILAIKDKDTEADTGNLEEEIDQLVYELYGLNDEEIGIVEGSI